MNPLRPLFFLLIVRPLVLVFLGLKVRHRERLPAAGPALVIANHNSHLDTLVLMTLFPLRTLRWLRPVAAADFFGRNRVLAWFTRTIIGAILIDRSGHSRDNPFAEVSGALEGGAIVIFYPEGTRGEPEQLGDFKGGIGRLAQRHPQVPVFPVFLHGLGKAPPKNDWLPVPFFVDVFVGQGLRYRDSRRGFMADLNDSFAALASEGQFPPWT